MTLLKRLEIALKYLAALIAGALLYRPWRRTTCGERLRTTRKVLLVRFDDRMGEALLTTPLLSALKRSPSSPEVHVLVHPKCVRILEEHPAVDRIMALDRRGLRLGPMMQTIRSLRRSGYSVVLNCANWDAPSVSAAIVARLIAARSALVGPAVFPVGWLHDYPVSPLQSTRSELSQRLHLLSPLGISPAPEILSFRKPKVRPEFRQFLDQTRQMELAVVNPGGRLGWRRIPPEAFVAVARELLKATLVPVVTWGPDEQALAQRVTSEVSGAILAPSTDLDELAALMARARLTVCNNTGPMHLSVAMGTPTLAFFLRMEVARWGHSYAPHRMVDLTSAVAEGVDLCLQVRKEVSAFLAEVLLSGTSNPLTPTLSQRERERGS